MKRLIIVGSPRSNGRSAHLSEMLFEACIDECPEDEVYLAPVSELDIAPCIACDACKKAGEAAAQAKLGSGDDVDAARTGSADGDGPQAEEDDLPPIAYCPRFDDDMLELYDVLEQADELIVVSPVFFSGAPAGLTALLDRLQPYFWEWLALRRAGAEGAALVAQKRPATLHVIGEGLDKNGYVALVSKVRSALAPAGFVLERVLDWVGRIAPDGTIEGEATEYRLPPLGVPLVAPEAYLLSCGSAAEQANDSDDGAKPSASAAKEEASSSKPAHAGRPARSQLNLSGRREANGSKSGKPSKSGGGKSPKASSGNNGARGRQPGNKGVGGKGRQSGGNASGSRKNGKRRG